MRIGAVVQARMASRRLPGKVLRETAGKPLLGYLLDRLDRARLLDAVIVATSDDEGDDLIAGFVQAHGAACFRGAHADVALRLRDAARAYGLDAFVRVSGDSPLLDQRLVDRAVELFRTGGFDLVTNVFPKTFPPGQSVEVVRTASLAAVYDELEDDEDREHVTPFFYRQADRFRIGTLTAEVGYDAVRLVVDTEDDLRRVAGVLARMERPHWDYRLDEVVALYRETAP